MSIYHPNPWEVETLQAFSFLNCPECSFKSKGKISFKNLKFCCKDKKRTASNNALLPLISTIISSLISHIPSLNFILKWGQSCKS